MSIMEWNDRLDIGVEDMNHQHQGLLKIMNELHDAFEASLPFSTQDQLMTELCAATIKHFELEETYMNEIGFPGLVIHKTIHEDLLSRFTDHAEKARAAQKLDGQFFTFLRVWLTAHIMEIDMKYAKMSKEGAA